MPNHTLAAAALVSIFALAAPARAELLSNGGFEAGNSGFTSGHTYVAPCAVPGKACGLWNEGTYAIGGNPQAYHPHFVAAPQGGSAFLMVNAAPVAGVEVWAERGIAVTPGRDYVFSAWVASLVAPSPAEVSFLINGVALDVVFVPDDTPGVWTQFQALWSAGATNRADITIRNANITRIGNDFALDELSFVALPGADPTDVPAPAALALFGLALAGLGVVRRRRV